VTVLDGNGTPRTVNESAYGNPWTFTGRRLDGETGLMYYRTREYDCGLGRFLNRNPWGYIQSRWSLYDFCQDSPAVYMEPFSTTVKPSEDAGWKKDGDGRWSKPAKDFREKDMTDAERKVGDTPKPWKARPDLTWYDWGCIGVTHCILQKTDINLKECYDEEAVAVAKAKEKKCPDGEKGNVFGVRYWDSKKDERKKRDDGTYPVDEPSVFKGKGPGFTNYDFGFRQSDGSFIHADHMSPGMNVKISPTSKEFEKRSYDGFNTYVYCVRCSPCTR
jgi:RHS repeat-associated protein